MTENADIDALPDNKIWLGICFCLCHAWLFSGVGVISRKLKRVHFAELMIHQAVQGIIILGLVLSVMAFCNNNLLGELSSR